MTAARGFGALWGAKGAVHRFLCRMEKRVEQASPLTFPVSPPIAGDAVGRAGERRMQDIFRLRLVRAVVVTDRYGRLPGLILVLLRHVVSS